MSNAYDKDVRLMRNKIEGAIGEIDAAKFLENKGYKILQKNFKTKFGEIDIVASKDGVTVFVEVKRRSTYAYGRPIEAVTAQKQSTIRKVAEVYLMLKHTPYADCRFDVIEVVGDRINHEENAF